MKKNYNLFYSSRVISGIGDALQDIAVITIISLFNNSAFISGFVVALNALVRVLCSLFAINNTCVKDCKRVLIYLNYLYAFITSLFYVLLIFDTSPLVLKISVVSYETICSLIYTFYKIYQDMIVKEVADNSEKIARLYATDNIIKILTSFISIILLLIMSYKGFLLINALSFLISGFIVSKLKVDLSTNKTQLTKNERFKIISNIKEFFEKYSSVCKIINLSAILSFFYSSYAILLQKAIKIYEIDIKYIGVLNAVYYVMSILLSYGAGYIEVKNIRKVSMPVLGMGFIFSILCLLDSMWIVVAFILIIYPIVGAGYNTVVQIYFQDKTSRDDIPILKGIYNIVCGSSILLSGFLTPFLLTDISAYFITMSLLFIFSIIYLCVSKV